MLDLAAYEVKDAAEQCLLDCKSALREQGKPEDAAKFLVHSGALIKPACSALTSKQPRLCILGMQLVVHLTNASALLPSHCVTIAPMLKDARDGLDESGSLKFLQLLSALCLLPAFVSQSQCSAAALSMLLPLHKDRNPVISQTAAAIAVMAVQSVIDVASSSGDTSAALSLIGDCTLLVINQVPKWLAVKDMPTSLSLELLHAALQCQPDMIKQAPQLLQVVQSRVCPVLQSMMLKPPPFAVCIRCLRLVSSVIVLYGMNLIAETERLLSALVAMADVKTNPPWRQAVAIESLRAMCVDADPALLRAMFVRYDTGTSAECGGVSVFQGITHCLGRIVQTSLEERGAVVTPVKLRLLEMLGSQEPPVVTNMSMIWDALDGVTGVVDGLALLLSRVLCGDDIGDEQGKRIVRRGVLPMTMSQERWKECAAKSDFGIIEGMTDTAWPGLLAALSEVLTKCNDDDVLQQVLKCYQTIVHTCAILQLYTPRDAFLTRLCKVATPRNGGAVTLKNVAAAKTLFNIAFCLPDLIQSAWPLLVDLLDCLDKMLPLSDARSIPTPTIQSLVEGDGGGQVAPLPELIIVRTALDNLFQHTSTYSETTVLSIIDSLAALCKSFFTSCVHDDVSTARSPPLDRICDILKHNVSRVTALWPFYLRVTMDAAQAAPVHIRSLVVKKFSGVVVSALRHHLVEARSPAADSVEVMVLRSLESFNAMSSHVDVRSCIVACILALLQSCGQALREGWPICLSIVKAVAVDGEVSLMVKAFQCVQLVQSDFVMDLPVDCLQLLVTTVAAFGQQTADTNIALTAVGLLWNIGDFFAKESGAIKIAFSSEDRKSVAACQYQTELTSQDAVVSSPASSDSGVASLWCRLLREMRQLCMDPRPEVRHCCLRSLSTTVQVHGAALHAAGTWEFCLWDVLFPLLVDVQECTAQAVLKEQSGGAGSAESDSLGLDKGKAVPLLVHHTRNTALKQWSETRVLVFHAVCRLVGVFMPFVSCSSRSDVACSTVMNALAAAVTSNTQEVAVSALQAFSEFSSSVNSIPHSWWPLIWAALGQVLHHWHISGEALIFPAVEEFVNLLAVLLPLGRDLTSSTDSAKLAVSVSGIMRLHDSSKSKSIAMMQQPSTLHTKTLNWLVAIAAPGCMPEVAHAVLSSLCELIPAAPLTDSASAVEVIVAAAVCNSIGQIIQTALPPPSVLSTLCLSMTQRLLVAASDRQRDIRSKLSFEGSSALLATVSLCLPQLHEAHDALVAVWEVACGGIGTIILGNYDVEVHEHIQEAVALCEAADLRAVQVCVDLLPLVSRDHQRLCRPLLHVFDAGVAHITSLKGRVFKRERLASTCMQILFDCAHGSISGHSENQELVACATVVVARRFRDILHRLQVDSDAAGICPLPKYRISQVALMVQLLTDGGPPALVSNAIINTLTDGAADGGSDNALLSADLVQRAGKHAMLLFVLSDLAASLSTADAALRIMIVSAVQTGLQAIGLQTLNWLDRH